MMELNTGIKIGLIGTITVPELELEQKNYKFCKRSQNLRKIEFFSNVTKC
jgi:hypothetical protein